MSKPNLREVFFFLLRRPISCARIPGANVGFADYFIKHTVYTVCVQSQIIKTTAFTEMILVNAFSRIKFYYDKYFLIALFRYSTYHTLLYNTDKCANTILQRDYEHLWRHKFISIHIIVIIINTFIIWSFKYGKKIHVYICIYIYIYKYNVHVYMPMVLEMV